ncbi:HPr family phosphocarrier protein [Corynebacterium diphtheriae]|nr:HPr family phosphocarrier protein [Corynebacterium diphtheriae]
MSAVGLVLVSHSQKLAEGLADLAGQMAGDVRIVPAGGLDDGSIGTSYDRIEAAVTEVRSGGEGVVILTDLGSATMTVEMVVDMADDSDVVFVYAPFVEAAIAAAVAAQQGGSTANVTAAARGAIASFTPPVAPANPVPEGEYSRQVIVADASGLHARPAAEIATMAADADDDVTINGTEADSALMIMGLGIAHGDTVTVAGSHTDSKVIDRIADAIAAGLDK